MKLKSNSLFSCLYNEMASSTLGSHKLHVVTSVDPFCIDIANNPEPSKAINSIFR